MQHYLLLFVFTFIAFFVKGITGFGNTLVMGPLFSFTASNRLITPVDLLFSIPTNAFMAWKERKSISLKVVAPLSLMMLAGIIPGVFLLKTGDDWILKSVLGVVVIGMAVEMLTRRPASDGTKKSSPALLLVIGLVSGVLAGVYGIGALLVAYVSRTTKDRSGFRANICCVFLADNLFRFFLYWATGILNREAFFMALSLSPAVILGMLAGIRIDLKLSEKTVKHLVIILLIVSGTILFLKSVIFK